MKAYFILIAILCLVFNRVFGQDEKPDTSQTVNFEVQPDYPGGMLQFRKFIANSLVYPELASLTGKSGRVIVSFTVEKDGSIADVKPLSCVGAGCESEAVRIIKSSRKWNPGLQNGKLVRVNYTVPINFNINKKFTPLRDFKRSNYGFVFMKDGKEYQLDDLKKLVGPSLQISSIESLSLYPEYKIPGKEEVYLIKLFSTED